jgi:predicted alpha/beta-fold hydrolase
VAHYQAPFFLFNAHLETIYPSLIRKVSLPSYTRERIATPDEDFLDLDWIRHGSDRLVIISHGLEGNSQRPYIKGMAKTMLHAGWDVLAWNYRGCSEEMNRQLRFYHSGATEDLHTVVQHATQQYSSIALVGFSLGGNLTLKYLGEATRPAQIKKAVAISVPMALESSCEKISQPDNWIYSRRFLKSLKEKILVKSSTMPALDGKTILLIKTLREFDDHYTGPLHGFRDAHDYYTRCSSLQFLPSIGIPTLILNAQNDPFLSPECYPANQLKNHAFVALETPERGGHVGFAQFRKNGVYWSEERAAQFLAS